MWSSVSGWVTVLRFQEEVRGGIGGVSVSGVSLLQPLSACHMCSDDKVNHFSRSSSTHS